MTTINQLVRKKRGQKVRKSKSPVLNVGFNTDNFKTDMDFEEIKHQIIKFNYQT